ncbi:SMI1/KNR4 family protein [Streptosporangium sp. CA-135522]|uniref:SMI1/KNR4 family protein n=1 Tax=Streptosporangium sp. CA-135522 TaxID=3240072 RepID=UPI003D8E8D70
MLRLITSRWVRLALAAAVAAAVVVAILRLRLRRRPVAVPGAVPRGEAETAPRVETEREAAPSWPPAPILGTPTAEDLKRYAVRPYIPRFLTTPLPAREPLDSLTRRRLTRWGAVAVALCLLVLGTQALENATFSKEAATSEEAAVGPAFATVVGSCERGGMASAVPPDVGGDRAETLCEARPPSAQDLFDQARGEDLQTPTTVSDPETSPAPEATTEPYPYKPVSDADCHPVTRAPRARPLSPRVVRAVNRQWGRIERWLKANAPASHRTLRPPARARTIAVAEAQMGLRFPNDLRASLLRHNGAAMTSGARPFGFLGDTALGVREIRDTWRTLCGTDDQDEDSEPRAEWWDGRMIPVGSDGSGDHLVIDSVRHDVGETDNESGMGFTPGQVSIRSHYALLKATADALETGGTVGYWKPLVTEGELDWQVADVG